MKRLALVLLFLLVALPASAANRFLTCNTACTITAIDTTIWGTTTGGTGASVPGSSDAVILDGATCVGGTTCTATMGAGYNPTWQSITMGACTASTTGCIFDWSVNNNNVTLTINTNAFSGTGSGTRTLKMGNGIWTISGTTSGNTAWTMATTTNLTLTANSSTIAITGSPTGSVTFNGGGLTYNALTVNNGRGGVNISGANTFATLTPTAPTTVVFLSGVTTTVTNLVLSGQSATNPVGLIASTSTGTNAATISSANSPTLSWLGVRNIAFTGGGTFAATSSFDLGGNTGITITAPQTGGGGIISGWLLDHDLNPANDNFPVFLNKAA